MSRHGLEPIAPQPAPKLTSAMVALAWAIMHGDEDPAVARALATMVLDASGDGDV
jgi:hypothetical protein